MGRPVYERLGFAADGRWLRLTPTAEATPVEATRSVPADRSPEALAGALDPPVGVRAGRAEDRDEVLALDRAVTGEDRGRLLRAVWGSGPAPACRPRGVFGGFNLFWG
jgi:hypothetical protein